MLKVGLTHDFVRYVTTLNWVGPRTGSQIEQSLGYGAGRLSDGYWIVLLKQELSIDDFEFAGSTLRSGGRDGLPAKDAKSDNLRTFVNDRMKREYSEADYKQLKLKALGSAKTFGSQRITKVIPVARNDPSLAPDLQYPMGGGGLQWNLVRPCRFLIAVKVDPDGTATTPRFTTNLGPSAAYENRAKVAQYLDCA